MTNATFQDKADIKHHGKYTYEQAIVTSLKDPVLVTCPTHGPFPITPDKHLYSGRGCPICSGAKSVKGPLTKSRLDEILTFDKATGKVYWKYDRVRTKAGQEARSVDTDGYLRVSIDKREYKLHRLVWFYFKGTWPVYGLDHKDGNVQNNVLTNLRDVPHAVNNKNSKKRKTNTSGHTGIAKSGCGKRWTARININKKAKHLGTFDTLEEAIAVRNQAKRDNGYSEKHGES